MAEKLRYRTFCAHEGDNRASASSSHCVSSSTEDAEKSLVPSMMCCTEIGCAGIGEQVRDAAATAAAEAAAAAAADEDACIEDKTRFQAAVTNGRPAEREKAQEAEEVEAKAANKCRTATHGGRSGDEDEDEDDEDEAADDEDDADQVEGQKAYLRDPFLLHR